MKKILFAVALFLTGAAFAATVEPPKLPDNIAEWSRVVDSTCDVKKSVMLHNVGYAIRTGDESMNIIIIYEKNGEIVYFMEGLLINGKLEKASWTIQTAQKQWVLLDKMTPNEDHLAFTALGVTEEEFKSCNTRQKHQ